MGLMTSEGLNVFSRPYLSNGRALVIVVVLLSVRMAVDRIGCIVANG